MRGRGPSDGKSPAIAVALAVLYPGLGHVYLRRWGRALLWFVLVVASVVTLIPRSAVPETQSFRTLIDSLVALPPELVVWALALSAMSVVDAYWIARREENGEETSPGKDQSRREETAQTCPNCGKEVDSDLDFCHWCTTELDRSDE